MIRTASPVYLHEHIRGVHHALCMDIECSCIFAKCWYLLLLYRHDTLTFLAHNRTCVCIYKYTYICNIQSLILIHSAPHIFWTYIVISAHCLCTLFLIISVPKFHSVNLGNGSRKYRIAKTCLTQVTI